MLVRDGLVDADYVERYTSGYDALCARLAEWTPDRAAQVTGLEMDEIEQLARDYGTTRPALIRTLIGAEHREHGAMLFRTIACLPLLTGDLLLGYRFGQTVANQISNGAGNSRRARTGEK